MAMDKPIWRRRYFDSLAAKGPKGDRGDSGTQGDTGPQGKAGDTGSEGPTGPAGSKGNTGDIGPTGSQGIQGSQGVKGDTGVAGPQGVKGDTGATGPQGIQGVKGDTGLTGAIGPAAALSTVTQTIGFGNATINALILGGTQNITVPLDATMPNTSYIVKCRAVAGTNLLSQLTFTVLTRATNSVSIRVTATGLASVAAMLEVNAHSIVVS